MGIRYFTSEHSQDYFGDLSKENKAIRWVRTKRPSPGCQSSPPGQNWETWGWDVGAAHRCKRDGAHSRFTDSDEDDKSPLDVTCFLYTVTSHVSFGLFGGSIFDQLFLGCGVSSCTYSPSHSWAYPACSSSLTPAILPLQSLPWICGPQARINPPPSYNRNTSDLCDSPSLCLLCSGDNMTIWKLPQAR